MLCSLRAVKSFNFDALTIGIGKMFLPVHFTYILHLLTNIQINKKKGQEVLSLNRMPINMLSKEIKL